MKYLFLILISSIAFTGFSKSFDPIVIGLDIGKQNHFSEFNSLSTPFSAIKKEDSDSTKQRRHGIYIEPWLFGRIVTFGYSYDFFKRDKFRITASIGAGMNFKFSNPYTAFYFPLGVESEYRLKKRFSISVGLNNYYYLNYWANFAKEEKDCFGLWNCPPDKAPFNLFTFFGVVWEFNKIKISPRISTKIIEFGDFFPFPTLKLTLKL